MQNSEAAGHGSEGDRKDGINGAVLGRDVQGGGAVGDILWQRYLGGNRVYAQGPGGVPPSVAATDHGDDGKTRGRRIVEVPIDSGGNGRCGSPPHWGVHQEAEENHIGEGGLTPCLCNVHKGGTDARNKPVGVVVGKRHNK